MKQQGTRRTRQESSPIRTVGCRLLWAAALLAGAWLTGCSTTDVRTASDASGTPVALHGSVVLIEPDIQLYAVTAGGMQEPRPEWTEAARRAYPAAVRELLATHGVTLLPDFATPPDVRGQLAAKGIALQPHQELPPPYDQDDRARQLLLLHQAVANSILLHGRPGADLATKQGRFDWTLGPGVSVLRDKTGADYALFTYIRDSYTGNGRAAMRVVGALLLSGDIGGGEQVGLASLVDLRSGQIVWFNLLVDQNGDLRDANGARATVASLLKQIPL